MDFADVTPEQMEKAKECKSVEELVALANNEGIELSNEQLRAIAGGGADTYWDEWTGCDGDRCTRFTF